ncbi:8-oxo-dGTP pyrophosphatase MutT (NUDIX family) [Kurthia huakuii]|nr:8-oxo-dGTP pyrophosphatase MutT (NUDIX family) [Kurthia huakuii]
MIEQRNVALIKRVKNGCCYYTFPGGKVEEHETVEEAAIREAYEELGLVVTLGRCFLQVPYNGMQYYYFAKRQRGIFGSGTGAEFIAMSPHDTYEAVWMPLQALLQHDIIPIEVAQKLFEEA